MSDFRISQVAASPSMTEPSTSGSERKLDRPAVVLGARSICKSFGRRAAAHQVLFDVDVDVYEGECLAVIGGSGSGKSTLTRIMLGLENADGGTVEYRGTPVLRGGSGLRRLRHDSGLIYQDPYGSLDPRWTVGDIVAEPLSLRWRGSRPDPAGIRENVHAALERVGLDAGVFIDRYPMDLSGGQAQRVAVGRAIVKKPDVFLFDEPLSNLDAKLREEARVFLRELIIKLGLSALMVTHDQNEAMAISDRILLLNNGVIEQQGTPQEMYGSPATLFAAEFMGSNNRLHGKVMALENGRARIEGASWSLWGRAGEGVSVGEPATAVIRVERLRLDGAAQDNSLQLPLLTSMYLGDRWEYLFRTEGDDFPLRAYGTALRDAEHCHLTLPAEDVWIFPQR